MKFVNRKGLTFDEELFPLIENQFESSVKKPKSRETGQTEISYLPV